MCQAPIGKVVNADGRKITVESNGKMVLLRSLIPDISVGDYVFFSSDMVVEKVENEEALLMMDDRK